MIELEAVATSEFPPNATAAGFVRASLVGPNVNGQDYSGFVTGV